MQIIPFLIFTPQFIAVRPKRSIYSALIFTTKAQNPQIQKNNLAYESHHIALFSSAYELESSSGFLFGIQTPSIMGDTASENSKGEEKKIYTYDQLIQQRALDTDQTPLIAYPKSRYGVSDYEYITGEDLNRFVDGGVKALLKVGMQPVVRSRSLATFTKRLKANDDSMRIRL